MSNLVKSKIYVFEHEYENRFAVVDQIQFKRENIRLLSDKSKIPTGNT